MKRFTVSLAAAAVALAAAVPASAATAQTAIDNDVISPVLWTVVAIAVFVVVGGVFYLLKRQLGAFPEHPDWVAPIEPIYSRDLPAEPATHDEPAEVLEHSPHDEPEGHGGHEPRAHTPHH
jgi:hypothetical protein